MIILYSILTILCWCIGFYSGYKLGDKKELPEVNPIKVAEKVTTEVTNIKKKKEQSKEINELNQVLKNIDRFDGTGQGQIPIKKG